MNKKGKKSGKEEPGADKGGKVYCCNKCSKKYRAKSGLWRHKRHHLRDDLTDTYYSRKIFGARWRIFKLKTLAESTVTLIRELEKEVCEDFKQSKA